MLLFGLVWRDSFRSFLCQLYYWKEVYTKLGLCFIFDLLLTEQIAVDATHHMLSSSELCRTVEDVPKNNSFAKYSLLREKQKAP